MQREILGGGVVPNIYLFVDRERDTFWKYIRFRKNVALISLSTKIRKNGPWEEGF